MNFESQRRIIGLVVMLCDVCLILLATAGRAQNQDVRMSKKENTMTQTSAMQSASQQTADKEAIRPFHVSIPEESLVDLRRRIAATKWPDRETVTDATQGVQLATMKQLADYWLKNYDWRKTR